MSDQSCGCWRCREDRMESLNIFIVCATCGNKRCPKANDHRNECTNSNDSGQAGSAYEFGSGVASARRFSDLGTPRTLPTHFKEKEGK